MRDIAKDKHLLKTLEKILEGEGISFNPLNGGINSSVYLAKSMSSKAVVKHYKNDRRNRLHREIFFLRHSNELGVTNTPKLLGFNQEENWSIMSYLSGKKEAEVNKSVIDSALGLLKNTNIIKDSNEGIDTVPLAAEACFSLETHFETTRRRVLRLITTKINHLDKDDETRKTIIIKKLLKMIKDVENSLCRNQFASKKINDLEIIISPSDVGIHNMINSIDRHYFIDFEYAGLDDVAKYCADWILQPEHLMSKEMTLYLVSGLSSYIESNSWRLRLPLLLRIYQIKWITIILNPIVVHDANSINSQKNSKKCLQKAIQYFEKSNYCINSLLPELA